MRRLALIAALLWPTVAYPQFLDGLPPVGVLPAPPLSESDIVTVCQGGTVGIPGTCTPRQTTASAFGSVIPNISLSSPPPIGNVLPNTGAFTSLSTTGNFAIGANQTITWSGTALSSPALTALSVSKNWIGDATGAALGVALNRIGVEQDNIKSPTTAVQALIINHRIGGTNTVGNRISFTVSGNQNTATGDAAAGHDPTYVAAFFTEQAQFNVGGTDTSIVNSRGHVFGANPQALLFAGATNYNHIAGAEIDVNSVPNVAYRSGLTVNSGSGAGKGQAADTMFWMYNSTDGAPWTHGMLWGGPNSVWPFDANSTMFGTMFAAAGTVNNAKWGIDLNEVTFPATGNSYEGGFLRSAGFAVDGAGRTRIGTTFLTPSAAGLAIDVIGSVGTVGTGAGPIAAGGSNYTNGVGFTVVRDLYGGVYKITAVAGVATSVFSVVRQPVFPNGSPPATSVTTDLGTDTGGPGTGLVLNLTWLTTANALAIQPTTGGKIGFNGATPIVKPTGVAVTAAGIHAALTSLGLIAP